MSDKPYDSGQDFGINHEYQFIPFKTQGSTAFFKYFVPTDFEVNTCPHMVLTDRELEWDPHDFKMAANRPYGDNYV